MTVRHTQAARVIAAAAAAGALGVVLVGCTPDEPIGDAAYTTPAVVTGNQAIPGDLVNADNVPASSEGSGSVDLADKSGKKVGIASITAGEHHGVKVSVRVDGLKEGAHTVAVTGGKCDGGTNFASVGTPISGGELAGVQVGHEGSGSTTSTVDALEIEQVNGKALVVKDDKETTVACGVIVAK